MLIRKSYLLDPVVYLLRLIIWIFRNLYLFGYTVIWKILPIGSWQYNFVRKIIRQRNTNKATHLKKAPDWKENLFLIINSSTQLEIFNQKYQTRKSTHPIGIVLYVDSNDRTFLKTTLYSIIRQSFNNWELLINISTEIPSTEKCEIQDWISEIVANHQIKYYDNNSILWNYPYILFTYTGDELSPDCLYWIFRVEGADIINFDVVQFDENNNPRVFCRPPGKSPELMISNNYLSHSAIKTASIKKVVEEIQLNMDDPYVTDFQFLLHLVHDETTVLYHIPKVLLKIRPFTGSKYLEYTRIKNISDTYEKLGLSDVKCTISEDGGTHVNWKTDGELVSIIIPSKDRIDLLSKCINSIREFTSYPNYEILIVDNYSQEDQTKEYYRGLSAITNLKIIPFIDSFNYSKAINLGASHARGKYLLLLNNDIEIYQKDWLTELVQWAMLPKVGVVGAKLLYPNDTIQHAGVVFDSIRLISHVFCHQQEHTMGPHGSVSWYRNYVGVTGACQMIRKEVFDSIGGYDEQFELTFSDIDICLRLIHTGFRVVYNPFCTCYHLESSTRIDSNPIKDIKRAFFEFSKTTGFIDPFYSWELTDSFNPKLRLLEPSRKNVIDIRLNNLVK